ncbi:hypothetical protein [Hymenobacter rigui]|uniref:Uncharacterized protein n=1 Tax=Hymenobacter rigui TaxID=334424 RepID=A0A428KG59_9BACT|nr:hypothetical protein [Hymenobacter rigui]RSK45324.1 hypothetical protein EI291_18370 [Hymenobacter rigui]
MLSAASITAHGQAQPAARAIPGTQVWLTPPAGFGPAAGFTGLRRGEAVLQVFDLKGSNYYQQAGGFSKARFEARGGQVLNYQEVQGTAYPARLVRVRLSPTQESSQLLFGDSTFAVLLDARYPAADTALASQLRRSLLSATYQKTGASVQPGVAVFALDEKKSPFALQEARSGRYVYTVEGQRPSEAASEPQIIITTHPYNPSITAADISRQVLSQRPGLTGFVARKMTSGKVNDLVTYETEGFAQLQGKRVLVYQQVSIVGSTAVAMQGIASQDAETALAQFKSLTHTITARK